MGHHRHIHIKYLLALLILGLTFLCLVRFQQNEFSSPLELRQEPRPFRKAFGGKRRPNIPRTHSLPVGSPLVINEIGFAVPEGPCTSEGMPADWIELYNRSEQTISLKDYSLTDSPNRPRKYILPDIILDPGETALIWADGYSGVSSPLTFKYLRSHLRAGWSRHMDFDTHAGYVWYGHVTQGGSASNQLELAYTVLAPDEGDYSIWVRHKPGRKGFWTLEGVVDNQQTVATYARPRKHYITSRLRNPDDPDGFWHFTRGEHQVRLILKDGETSVDHIVLTRRNVPFGTGRQDVHAPFKLRRAGELVALHSPRGMPLDYVTFDELPQGRSYQRSQSGKGHFTAGRPTPNEMDILPAPEIRPVSGIMTGPVQVVIRNIPTNASVHYTVDGSLPTRQDPRCTQPFILTNSVPLRVRMFREDAYPSPVVNRVYWLGAVPAMPVLWCLMQPTDLQSSKRGVLSNPRARGPRSERACFMTLLMPNGHCYQTEAGLRLQGRSTRRMQVKKSCRLFFRPRYGNPVCPVNLFDAQATGSALEATDVTDRGAASFAPAMEREQTQPDRALPRKWPREHSSLVLIGHSIINHPIGLDVMNGIGSISPRVRHVLFQINDHPMGIYICIEDPNDTTYLEQLYGHLDLDVFKQKTLDPVKMGDREAFEVSWEALAQSKPEDITLEKVARIIDPVDFVRWAAGMQFIAVEDNGQGYFIRDQQAPAPAWSFINWDMDGSMAVSAMHKHRLLPIMRLRGRILKGLLSDPDFPMLYVNEFQKLLNHRLMPEPWIRHLARYQSIIMPHMDFEFTGNAFQHTELVDDYTRSQLSNAYKKVFADSRAFFETQNEGVRRILHRNFRMDNYREVTVDTATGDDFAVIDGFPEKLPYRGLYFPGTTLDIHPGAAAGAGMVLQVNGKTVNTTHYHTVVTDALRIHLLSR